MSETAKAEVPRPGGWVRWRASVLLGLASIALWIVPLLRGHGPYGHGVLKLVYVYSAVWVPLLFAACLAVALVPARLRRPLALRLAAILAAVFMGLPLCDLAATFYDVRFGQIWYYSLSFPRSQNTPDPDLIWQRRPNLSWHGRKTPDCEPVLYQTDEHGFRNPPGIHKADIVFIGDSVTEAGEVDAAATFVRKVGETLKTSTVNLGTSGYGPQQELAVLLRYGLAYQPRVVVWQFTEWNDLIDAQMYLDRQQPAAHTLPPWELLYTRHSPVMRLVSALLPGKRPKSVAFRRSDGRVDDQAFWPYNPQPHKDLPEAFTATRDTLAVAFEICRSRGIEFVVLYVPSHVRVLLPYVQFKNQTDRERFCPGGLADRDDDLAHALAASCRELGCPLIDLTPPLRQRAAVDNRRIYVRNDPHLSTDGHAVAHEAIVQFLQARQAQSSGTQVRR